MYFKVVLFKVTNDKNDNIFISKNNLQVRIKEMIKSPA